jgi:hypothetical protein
MNTDDLCNFRGYLKNCTDAQVYGVYEKESKAKRKNYVELAVMELVHRKLTLPPLLDHFIEVQLQVHRARRITGKGI